MDKLCTAGNLFVQLTQLKHVSSAQNVFVFNCHAPTSVVTEQRRREVVTRLMEIGNEAQRSGGPHPAAAWVVGGDLNMSGSALMQVSSKYAKAKKPCFSRSGMRVTNDAQKSDIAISQGIALDPVDAWVGAHFQPCVSDEHNMVLVAGSLDAVAAPELDRFLLVRDSNPSPFPRPPMPLRAPPTDEEVSVAPAAEAAGPPQWALPEATAAVDAAP